MVYYQRSNDDNGTNINNNNIINNNININNENNINNTSAIRMSESKSNNNNITMVDISNQNIIYSNNLQDVGNPPHILLLSTN